MRTSILSPGSMCQSVMSGSLTLRDTKIRDFRMKYKKIRTTEFLSAGKYLRKQQEIAIRNFQIQNKTRVEPSYPEIGGEIIMREECNYSN